MTDEPKMTYEKAKAIISSHELAKENAHAEILDILEIGKAYGFIEGWEARMKYEAEINGEPKELGE